MPTTTYGHNNTQKPDHRRAQYQRLIPGAFFYLPPHCRTTAQQHHDQPDLSRAADALMYDSPPSMHALSSCSLVLRSDLAQKRENMKELERKLTRRFCLYSGQLG
jgi:hypothetical protein